MTLVPFRLATALLVTGFVVAACDAPTAPADAPQAAAPASPDVSPFRIGALQAWSLKDGDIVMPVAAAEFPWTDGPAVQAALTAGGQPTDQIRLSIQPLLIKDGEHLVLIDTGAGGAMGTEGKLVASLRTAGFQPTQVTDVLISHAHGDHVGGLVDADGRLAFPNAVVRMSTPEWAFAQQTAEAEGAGPLLAAITPKVQAFAPGAQVTPSIKAVPLPGHTPGHSGYQIASGDGRLLYIGDALHSSVISVARPDLVNGWDSDSPAAVGTRRQLLANTQWVYAGHFPFPGRGRFQPLGEGYVWAAER
ncbi:MBL fold metallo-hydrolase [Brevundimonas sp. Leaf363]|uniref:MBL fold metallo-hydrolase n=1 Tax=Brevundimonas sp. Leaf363 TaxID=1736353 RepID=UPI000B11A70C|nr:MBL fold metallo-hydrolase [Brevundimonas sp. Leaf363]